MKSIGIRNILVSAGHQGNVQGRGGVSIRFLDSADARCCGRAPDKIVDSVRTAAIDGWVPVKPIVHGLLKQAVIIPQQWIDRTGTRSMLEEMKKVQQKLRYIEKKPIHNRRYIAYVGS